MKLSKSDLKRLILEEMGSVVKTMTEVDELSDEEIEAELKKLQAEYNANKYQRDRLYPELGEQLDMLFHDMTAGKGDKTGEWYKAISKVKSDHPKP